MKWNVPDFLALLSAFGLFWVFLSVNYVMLRGSFEGLRRSRKAPHERLFKWMTKKINSRSGSGSGRKKTAQISHFHELLNLNPSAWNVSLILLVAAAIFFLNFVVADPCYEIRFRRTGKRACPKFRRADPLAKLSRSICHSKLLSGLSPRLSLPFLLSHFVFGSLKQMPESGRRLESRS